MAASDAGVAARADLLELRFPDPDSALGGLKLEVGELPGAGVGGIQYGCNGPNPRRGEGIGVGSSGPGAKSGLVHATPSVVGALPYEVVARIVRSKIVALQKCADVARKQSRALTGDVVLSFSIDGEGGVGSVDTAKSTLSDAALRTCMGAVVRRAKFPVAADKKPVSVEYTLKLEAPSK